jgi:hypothetical protein
MDKIKLYGFALAGGIGFWFIFYKFSTLALEFFVRTF